MRLIDANKLERDLIIPVTLTKDDADKLMHRIIDEAPTIDAVEVVRCEECKNWNGVLHGGFYYFETCELTSMSTNSGDYCSYGERKESIESEVEE